jgi:hypothetical protein
MSPLNARMKSTSLSCRRLAQANDGQPSPLPAQTYIGLQHLDCPFDLAVPTPFWIIAGIEIILMEFRRPKALVNLHGRRQSGSF